MNMGKRLVGVRSIVAFELKSGSIDERSSGSEHSALEGTLIHQRLQKRAGADYQKEVTLKWPHTLADGSEIVIDGRMDGLIYDAEADHYTIDEIKTSETAFDLLDEATLRLYWGQLRLYGYLFLKQQPQQTKLTLRLTYYQTLDKQISQVQEETTPAKLKAFVEPLLQDYFDWQVTQNQWQAQRQKAAKALHFPFPAFRNKQRSLAASVYKTILTKQKLLVEAPTGTGKTMATLFPAIKTMGTSDTNRIFYFTAKQSTRHIAEKALATLEKSGALLKAVTLTAKDKICFMEERICTPEHCPFANGYFDRRKTGLRDILDHENQLDRTTLETYAKKHELCPFEFSLDASLFADVIICDYNYLFDPIVYLQRFFADKAADSIFLVDESHNLVSRARAMYSAELTDGPIAQCCHDLTAKTPKDPLDKKLLHRGQQILDAFDRLTLDGLQDGAKIQKEAPLDLLDQLRAFIEIAHDWLAAQGDTPLAKKVLAFYLNAIRFTRIDEFYDETYYTEVQTQPDIQVRLLCFDPAKHLGTALDKGRASILFSATLSPMSYYQSVFGIPDSLVYRLPSPFPAHHQRILIPSYIQTTYRHREQSLPKISASLKALIDGATGNYLIFCPSYRLLEQVQADFSQRFPTIRTIRQDSDMTEPQRQAFLSQFVADPKTTLVGFAILGGLFSEGIDLTGNRLIGTAIITVGLPGLSLARNTLKTYFDAKNHQGFAYAYQLPGMNHVLQAAGRLIRQNSDKGLILLLDQRFLQPAYQQYFPAHWQSQVQPIHSPQQLHQAIQQFWQAQKEDGKHENN